MTVFRISSLGATLSLLLPLLSACASQPGAAQTVHTAPAAKPVIIVDDAPLPPPVPDGEPANLLERTDVQQFMDGLVGTHGFQRAELEAFFSSVRLNDNAIQLMRPAPPGQPRNWQTYRARFVEPTRINAGLNFWNAHEATLKKAEATYGVPPEIIVGIIGVETLYGRYTGRYRVPDVLTTLAFAYPDTPNRIPRMEYFRREVANVLLLARERGIDPFTLTGSYAGAIGLPQFMPGSIRAFAVDFDGDSKIDLLNSPADAIGSVANFLVRHGWQSGQPFAFPASVSDNPEEWGHLLKQGLAAKNTLEDVRRTGVRPQEGTPPEFRYGLVDLQNGTEPTEYWLGTPNFFAITHYNRSYFYAMAVIDLGLAVKQAKQPSTPATSPPASSPASRPAASGN